MEKVSDVYNNKSGNNQEYQKKDPEKFESRSLWVMLLSDKDEWEESSFS